MRRLGPISEIATLSDALRFQPRLRFDTCITEEGEIEKEKEWVRGQRGHGGIPSYNMTDLHLLRDGRLKETDLT